MSTTTAPNHWPAYAWMDGEVVPWNECRLHVRTQGAFWGANIFEGLRGYWQPATNRVAFFCVEDHLARLRASAKCLRMPLRFSEQQLATALDALAKANEFRTHLHAVVGVAYGMGPRAETLDHIDVVHTHITAHEAPRSPNYVRGIAAGTASWRRISDESMPPRIKTGANYHNSRLAHQEAVASGYHTALILNNRGTLAEAPGSCVAAVIGDEVVSPPTTAGALPGITLSVVAKIAGELGMQYSQREIDRTELYLASEVMLCGTLAEIVPVTSIDRIPIGDGTPGPIVRRIQERFERLTGTAVATDET